MWNGCYAGKIRSRHTQQLSYDGVFGSIELLLNKRLCDEDQAHGARQEEAEEEEV